MIASLLALTAIFAGTLPGTCSQNGFCPALPLLLAAEHGGMGGTGGGMGGASGGMGTGGGGMSRGGAMGGPLDRFEWSEPTDGRPQPPAKSAEQGPQCVTRSSRCTFPASAETARGKPCHCAGSTELGRFE
ncbi:MAG: hypothetical protein JOZ42_01275 [Acetobacteraceae bacterium]|nr:hypothetical protein [Acetobacteraceae bacterium]